MLYSDFTVPAWWWQYLHVTQLYNSFASLRYPRAASAFLGYVLYWIVEKQSYKRELLIMRPAIF